MKPLLRRRFGVITLTVLFFLAAPSLAARRGGAVDGGSDVTIARATIAPHLVSFEPLADYESMSLRVTGAERVVFEGDFTAGQAILFDLYDLDGNPLEDGIYTYELVATPRLSGEIRLAMESARLNGTDGEAGRRLKEIGLLPRRGSMTMSGTFTILGGAVVDPNLPEESAAAPFNPGYNAGATAPQDQVVNDDKIIIGSLCVGFDCINGESFGFDTIRLKENNLRLHFQDTSNTASFPTRDWRWVANDSSNGGASYMGLEDSDNSRFTFRVFHGAPSNALTVDAQGDVGLGTLNATVELHVVDGDTPTLRLEQDGSSGFTPQTWDVAGNETNFFVRDVTNGSGLPFRIRPGAGSNAIYIDTDADVGVGTSSPDSKLHVFRSEAGVTANGNADELHVEANGNAGITISAPMANRSRIAFGNPSQALAGEVQYEHATNDMAFFNNATERMVIRGSNGFVGIGLGAGGTPTFPIQVGTDATNGNNAMLTTGGVWMNGSSRESKKDIRSLDSDLAMSTLEGLQPVRYQYRNQTGEEYVGFIAEDVPELVAAPGRKTLSPMDIVAVLTKVVQDQEKTIAELGDRLRQLEGQVKGQ